jgi:acyl carrier protein
MKNVNNDLKELFGEFGLSTEKLTLETRIEEDLRITGDDAVGFLLAYSKKFNVDVSAFNADDYFEGEIDMVTETFLRLFLGKKKRLKNLKIAHLEAGIIHGTLNEDVINSG